MITNSATKTTTNVMTSTPDRAAIMWRGTLSVFDDSLFPGPFPSIIVREAECTCVGLDVECTFMDADTLDDGFTSNVEVVGFPSVELQFPTVLPTIHQINYKII